MYLAIYKDLTNKKTRYYYIKDDKIYYDEYSGFFKKTVKVKSLDSFFSLFKNTKDSLLVKNDGSYYVYFDSDYYKRYVKEGKEDFLKFFEENGKDALFYIGGVHISSALKEFCFKTSTGVVVLVASAGLFKMLNNPPAVNIEQEEAEVVFEVHSDFSNQDIVLALESNLDSLSYSRIIPIVNSNLIPDVLKYYDKPEKNILYYVKLDKMGISYYDEEKEPDFDGYYNLSNPNIINIRNDVEVGNQFHVFTHEFVHLLQDTSTHNYLDEPVAELMCSEYLGFVPNSYLDEVINLKLLIRTIGREPILKSSFGGDNSELFEILENNLENTDYEKMRDMLSTRFSDYRDNRVNFNKELKSLIEKLYFNINGVKMMDLDDYDLLTFDQDKVIDKSLFVYENSGSLTQNEYFTNKVDNRKFLKESSEHTISYEIPYYDGDIIPYNAEKIDYFKKQITIDEYTSLSFDSSDMTLAQYTNFIETKDIDDKHYYLFDIDGRRTSMEFETAVETGLIKFYAIKSADQLDSFDGYTYALSRLRVTKIVDPILNRYDEVRAEEVVSSNNIGK